MYFFFFTFLMWLLERFKLYMSLTCVVQIIFLLNCTGLAWRILLTLIHMWHWFKAMFIQIERISSYSNFRHTPPPQAENHKGSSLVSNIRTRFVESLLWFRNCLRFLFFNFFLVFLPFLGPLLRHVEVPRSGF